jgi:hypothetical protein
MTRLAFFAAAAGITALAALSTGCMVRAHPHAAYYGPGYHGGYYGSHTYYGPVPRVEYAAPRPQPAIHGNYLIQGGAAAAPPAPVAAPPAPVAAPPAVAAQPVPQEM